MIPIVIPWEGKTMHQVYTFCYVDMIFKTKNTNGKFILIWYKKQVHIYFVDSLVLHGLFLLVCEKDDDNKSEAIDLSTETQHSPEKNDNIQNECKFNINNFVSFRCA